MDDILLFGRTEIECLNNIYETKKLHEYLGFVLNMKKCKLKPSQQCDYLGFTFDSVDYSISLTDGKRVKLLKLAEFYKKKCQCKIREWVQFVGNLVAASPALSYSNLYSKNFERCKYLAILMFNGDYNKNLIFSNEIYKDLEWWIEKLPFSKNKIRDKSFKFTIFSDASLTGWGICCGDKKSYGFWSAEEKLHYINFLALKAVQYGFKCFADDFENCDILLRTDNTTAVSYIYKMGSIQFPELSNLSREIWQWCEIRKLYIFA